eukprot:CAMPEP_0176118856 /NCGR_PEP_ID=MMETSP0120_2-20121206/59748_1 /TAXON_ID=160619 /ORGANISM="Kryptoperidinium foliaceum, Strain CCMP 1326" /LENGTH=449 /DNA_ID=CAMNT_0017453229 /DNA_START=63 /DNA_END=1410 /DNA_ORIENTATION=-
MGAAAMGGAAGFQPVGGTQGLVGEDPNLPYDVEVVRVVEVWRRPRQVGAGYLKWCALAGVALLLGAACLAATMWAPGTETSTTQPVHQFVFPETTEPPSLLGECTMWGDPHVRTFDGGLPAYYGEGEFYVVKSDTVNIQGRFRGTTWTGGLAATNGIAVGGPFLNDHVIIVGSLEDGAVRVDGIPIEVFPSEYSLPDGLANISYTAEGTVVDEATMTWRKHVVRMSLPFGVQLEVFRWTNYVDVRLSMARQPGQDGACSNFDGNVTDDTTEAVLSRTGFWVPDDELLFERRLPASWTETETKMLEDCPDSRRTRARTECAHDVSGLRGAIFTVEMRLCMLDICYGDVAHALQTAEKLGYVERPMSQWSAAVRACCAAAFGKGEAARCNRRAPRPQMWDSGGRACCWRPRCPADAAVPRVRIGAKHGIAPPSAAEAVFLGSGAIAGRARG